MLALYVRPTINRRIQDSKLTLNHRFYSVSSILVGQKKSSRPNREMKICSYKNVRYRDFRVQQSFLFTKRSFCAKTSRNISCSWAVFALQACVTSTRSPSSIHPQSHSLVAVGALPPYATYRHTIVMSRPGHPSPVTTFLNRGNNLNVQAQQQRLQKPYVGQTSLPASAGLFFLAFA